jgi:hypothetical protein
LPRAQRTRLRIRVEEKIMKQSALGIIIAIGLTLPTFGEEVIKLPDGIYVLNLAKSTLHCK